LLTSNNLSIYYSLSLTKILINYSPQYFLDNLISIDLLEWARECFPSTQSVVPSSQEGRPHETSFLSSIMESLMQQEKPELHDSYWNAVKIF